MKLTVYAAKHADAKLEPFSYERKMGRKDVLIAITHCGIATGDIQMISNAWGDSKFPLVPGHEIIGTVAKKGSGVIDLKIGDRVGIGYQLMACFKCEACKTGNEQFCLQQQVVGANLPGGLAQQIIVDYRFAFKIPAKLNSSKSASLLSSGLTVYSAITRANLSKKSYVAVLGIGGLGHLAIQFLHKMGHDVIGFSRSAGKSELIRKLGGKFVNSANLHSDDFNRKFDFILSTLNVEFDLNTYLKMLSPQGKFCVVAQPPTKMPLNIGLLYDYAQRTIYGSYTGSRKDMKNVLSFSARHNIEAIVDVMPFSQMNEAMDLVRAGKVPIRMVLQNKD